MSRIRNILFTAIVAIILWGAIAIAGLTAIGLSLPSWLTAEDSKYLIGGVEETDLANHFNLASFLDKTFQNELTSTIENEIPFKAELMLRNAWLQRIAISQMASIRGYSCYPTYYGSPRLYMPSKDVLFRLPKSVNKRAISEFETFGKSLAAFANAHQDIRFIVLLVAGNEFTAYNPAYNLCKNPLTAAKASDTIISAIGEQDNVIVLTDSNDYASVDEYYEAYFKTDHHWNIKGATALYNQAADKGALKPFENNGIIELDGFLFHGSDTRYALQIVNEPAFDGAHDYSNVTQIWNDGRAISGNDHAAFYSDVVQSSWDFYNMYYEAADMYTSNGADTALLIVDSYGAILAKPIAENYETLYRYADLHFRHKGGSLEDLLDRHHPKDVWIIADLEDCRSFVERCPNYFDFRDHNESSE